ncbi:MAG: DUF368 domain-containing protein [Oscillospiraceae bacterium]|nr:DUF368 domain-containing protein [Oscillospiraceae bacterium]
METHEKNEHEILQRSFLLLCIQGAIVGVGAILPGVSGGVLCLAFGLYEPMMSILAHPKKAIPRYYRIFIPFCIGWAVGFLLLAGVVDKLFTVSADVAVMLFSGLIFGTVPELLKGTQQKSPNQSWSPFVLSLAGAYMFFQLLAGGESLSLQPGTFWYFFCGAVWGLSMVIPGLSSSSLLIFMGLYQPMTKGIAALNFEIVVPMLTGLLLTALLLARLVSNLFERHNALVLRVVAGFMIASTLIIMPVKFSTPLSMLISVICFAAGFACARVMDAAEKKS